MTKYIKTEKKVKVGQVVRIHCSQAFLGIEEGVVKITDFVPWDKLPSFIDKEAYAEDSEYIKEEVWVKYEYIKGEGNSFRIVGEVDFFPASWFLEHITVY